MTITDLAEDVIERFASVPAANVADAQERFGVAAGLVAMLRCDLRGVPRDPGGPPPGANK